MVVETTTLIYSMIGGFMILGLGGLIFVISGKSIFYDIYRRIVPNGVDVFILNSSRQLTQHYKVPKDGQIKINKKMYITNPDKILSMEDKMKQEVIDNFKEREANFKKRIHSFNEKLEQKEEELNKIENTPGNQAIINQYKEYIVRIKSKINVLEEKKKSREQVYYHRKRGAFIYIEGDPIPKDLHEWYTEMDSLSIDNVIARSMTKDPKAVRDLEKELKMMKFLLVITLIAAAAAAIIGVTIKTDIQTIAQGVGVTLTL